MSAPGTVYLVGAGPGAPDLLTVRAARLLEHADIIFHDALVHPDTLALAARAIKIPVGKRCGRHSTAQHFINKQLVDAAHRYAIVVRLKGGDPMIFGRSQEELDALASAGIATEVVPGITAALAAAAQLRVSLTRRGVSRSVTFATPRVGAGKDATDWSAAITPADSAAIYMGANEAEKVMATLLAGGHAGDTPVMLCESASLPQWQAIGGKLRQLPHLAAQLGEGPALILIGAVFKDARQSSPQVSLTAPARAFTGG